MKKHKIKKDEMEEVEEDVDYNNYFTKNDKLVCVLLFFFNSMNYTFICPQENC